MIIFLADFVCIYLAKGVYQLKEFLGKIFGVSYVYIIIYK